MMMPMPSAQPGRPFDGEGMPTTARPIAVATGPGGLHEGAGPLPCSACFFIPMS